MVSGGFQCSAGRHWSLLVSTGLRWSPAVLFSGVCQHLLVSSGLWCSPAVVSNLQYSLLVFSGHQWLMRGICWWASDTLKSLPPVFYSFSLQVTSDIRFSLLVSTGAQWSLFVYIGLCLPPVISVGFQWSLCVSTNLQWFP